MQFVLHPITAPIYSKYTYAKNWFLIPYLYPSNCSPEGIPPRQVLVVNNWMKSSGPILWLTLKGSNIEDNRLFLAKGKNLNTTTYKCPKCFVQNLLWLCSDPLVSKITNFALSLHMVGMVKNIHWTKTSRNQLQTNHTRSWLVSRK